MATVENLKFYGKPLNTTIAYTPIKNDYAFKPGNITTSETYATSETIDKTQIQSWIREIIEEEKKKNKEFRNMISTYEE